MINYIYLCSPKTGDSLAQQVEHNTFNVGVLGSSPRRITKKRISNEILYFCVYSHNLTSIPCPKSPLFQHRINQHSIPCPNSYLFRHRIVNYLDLCPKSHIFRHRIVNHYLSAFSMASIITLNSSGV